VIHKSKGIIGGVGGCDGCVNWMMAKRDTLGLQATELRFMKLES
jgi:hypothetical protein